MDFEDFRARVTEALLTQADVAEDDGRDEAELEEWLEELCQLVRVEES